MPKRKDCRFMDYIVLNIYSFALAVVANSLHPIILPLLVQEMVPRAWKASCLGSLIFAGLLVAIVTQPVMGALSDRSTHRWGRRRPFILTGTLLSVAFLAVIALAGNYWILLAGVLFLQFASNTAQGPYQGLMPDLIPEGKRGTASGVKTLMEAVGVVAAAPVAGYLMSRGERPLALGFLMALLLVTMLITILGVREEPRIKRAPSKALLTNVLSAFDVDVQEHPGFAWWLINRFLFLVGLSSLQTFVLYFIEDVVGLPDPATAAGNLMVVLGLGVALVILAAGYLADRVGQKPLLVAAGLGAALGVFLLPSAHGRAGLLAYGGLIGLSAGVFVSVSWALATNLVPPEEAGRYLGITNLATAGGSAVARLGGPIVDLFNARRAGLGYTVLFAINGLCFLLATLAILRVRGGGEGSEPTPPVR